MLEKCGMEVVGQAATPQDCIEGILSSLPDVVVMDIGLQGGSGLEVLRAVRRVQPGIAFVVLSNNSSPAYRKRYLAEGAVRFLDKSAEFHQLIPTVQNAPLATPGRPDEAMPIQPPPMTAATPRQQAGETARPRIEASETPLQLLSESMERERAEHELRESEKRFRALITASSDVLYSMSADWSEMRQLSSDGFVEATEDPISGWLQKYVHPDDQAYVLAHIDEAIRKKSVLELEHRVRRADGSFGWTHSRAIPLLDVDGEIFEWFGVATDISERKLVEETLQAAKSSAERARAEAERANQAKDQFIAVLSHELRTPLTPVLAAVQLLQRRPDLTEETRAPLEIIRRNVQLQARLIDDLLDLTRIAQGKLELKRKPINLETVIEGAVEVAKPDLDARRLHFAVIAQDAHCRVDADASRLQQVIWNLLTNAVKFTPEDGCVGLRFERNEERVVIEVCDSGIGVEPEAADKIFNAFEQGGRGITRQFGGLGLGLAIAKRLVEMHDGTISVQSEGRNQGATFRIELPLSSAELALDEQRSAAPSNGGARRILLVEDNGDTAQTMKMLLEICGYVVETAGDVKQALEAVESANFDLLVSDLGLPDGSGIDLMEELRRRGCSLKGIALSGYGQEEVRRRTKQAGFSAHLVKPADADALLETIAALV